MGSNSSLSLVDLVKNDKSISGRPNESKVDYGKARVPRASAPLPSPPQSGPEAVVDVRFHKGWYFQREDVTDLRCKGVDAAHFLPQMAQVVIPIDPPIYHPNWTIERTAEKLMTLLHEVMHHKQLHSEESMLDVHRMRNGVSVAPIGCWQFMWPVQIGRGGVQGGDEALQRYECYTMNHARQLMSGTQNVGNQDAKGYLGVRLGFGLHPPVQRRTPSKRHADKKSSVGAVDDRSDSAALNSGCMVGEGGESSGHGAEAGGSTAQRGSGAEGVPMAKG